MQGSYNWKYRRAYTSCVLDVDRAQVRFLHLAPLCALKAQWSSGLLITERK